MLVSRSQIRYEPRMQNPHSGKASMRYQLPDNTNRTVAYNTKTGRPEDLVHQEYQSRIPPQIHY